MKIEELDVNIIIPNPFQARKNITEESLLGLAESMRKEGQKVPIRVTRYGGHLAISDGERRWRVAKDILRWKTITGSIENLDEEGLRVENLLLNIQREDFSPIDKAIGIKLLLKKSIARKEPLLSILKNMEIKKSGFSEAETQIKNLLTSLGISFGEAMTFLKVLELPKKIQEDMELKWSQKKDIARLDDAAGQKRVYKKVKKEKLGVSGTKRVVDRVVIGEIDRKTLEPKETYNKDLLNLVRNGTVALKETVTQFLSEFETFPEIIRKKVLEKISELMIVCEELARKIEGAEEFDEEKEETLEGY